MSKSETSSSSSAMSASSSESSDSETITGSRSKDKEQRSSKSMATELREQEPESSRSRSHSRRREKEKVPSSESSKSSDSETSIGSRFKDKEKRSSKSTERREREPESSRSRSHSRRREREKAPRKRRKKHRERSRSRSPKDVRSSSFARLRSRSRSPRKSSRIPRDSRKQRHRSRSESRDRFRRERDESTSSFSALQESKADRVVSRVWNIKTFSSANYKMIHVNSKMSTGEFIAKVAKIFNLKKQLICVTYEFPHNSGGEAVKVEIEEGDESSLLHAIDLLKDYSKLTAEVKLLPSPADYFVIDGKRKARSKEVVSEQLKRELGLHDDSGKRKRGFLDSKWTEQCDRLLSEDSRFLLQFDKLKSGVKLVFGSDGYLLNPVQVICPICLEIKVLSSMNQPRSLSQHFRDMHHDNPKGRSLDKRLNAWLENNFITEEALAQKEALPGGLVSPTELLSTPRVRAMVLARDIS